MKRLLILLFILIGAVTLNAQLLLKGKPLFVDSSTIRISISTEEKPLLEITGKDTVIYDTLGLIRWLLKKQTEDWEEISRYRKQVWRAYEILNSISGILVQEPKRKQHFKL